MEIRLAQSTADCVAAVAVIDRIWGPGSIDLATVVAIMGSGGYVALAGPPEEPVGAAVGFCGPPGHPFHSHIVGVVREQAGRGLGARIKRHQREWCLGHGITAMTWTYDPLVARNAHFNLTRLGARALHYQVDRYGDLDDALNAGQGSDRFTVRWALDREPDPVRSGDAADAADAVVMLAAGDDAPGPVGAPGPADTALIGIPSDIEGMRRTDPDLARAWRGATRAAFTTLLEGGWTVTGFRPDRHYLLTRHRTAEGEN